jgi:hypothetical protein
MTENTDFKIVLYTLLVLGGLAAFFLSGDRLRDGFLFFIATLGLGFRTLALTPALKIIPAEIILWILPFIATRQDRALVGNKKTPLLPWWLWAMLPFWAIAWIPNAENGFPWDQRVAEFRNFLMAIPLFWAAAAVLARPGRWRMVVVAFLGVSIWISAMGITEYVFPGIAQLLPGFIGNPEPNVSGTFKRAAFSFYGSAIAVFICSLALPLSLAVWQWWPSAWARMVTLAGALLQGIALYISGYRSLWLLLGAQVILFFIVKKKYGAGVLTVCLALVGYGLLPGEAQDRLHSLEMVLRGTPEDIDTSGEVRWDRAEGALGYALQQPIGHGWAASGWVHSDFLQVAANQGLAAGILFVAAYAVTLTRLGLRLRSRRLPPECAALGVPLLLSFVSVGGFLLFEGVEFLPQTILPLWLVWALAETWLTQTTPVRSANNRIPSHKPFALARAAARVATAGGVP